MTCFLLCDPNAHAFAGQAKRNEDRPAIWQPAEAITTKNQVLYLNFVNGAFVTHTLLLDIRSIVLSYRITGNSPRLVIDFF
jgi:hypothetical protein